MGGERVSLRSSKMPQMRMSLSGCRSSDRIRVSAPSPPPTITARRSMVPLRAQRRMSRDISRRRPKRLRRPVPYQVANQRREKSCEVLVKNAASAIIAKTPDHTSAILRACASGLRSVAIW